MKELLVTVQYRPQVERNSDTIRMAGVDKLTPALAIAARNVAAGVGASAWVHDDDVMYRVVGNRARKV